MRDVYQNIVAQKVNWLQLNFCCSGVVKGDNCDAIFDFTMLVYPEAEPYVTDAL